MSFTQVWDESLSGQHKREHKREVFCRIRNNVINCSGNLFSQCRKLQSLGVGGQAKLNVMFSRVFSSSSEFRFAFALFSLIRKTPRFPRSRESSTLNNEGKGNLCLLINIPLLAFYALPRLEFKFHSRAEKGESFMSRESFCS